MGCWARCAAGRWPAAKLELELCSSLDALIAAGLALLRCPASFPPNGARGRRDFNLQFEREARLAFQFLEAHPPTTASEVHPAPERTPP